MQVQSTRNTHQTSFGKFTQPTGSVIAHFQETMSKMKPEARENFVRDIGNLVKKSENNPVLISQRMIDNSGRKCYKLEIGDNTALTVAHPSSVDDYPSVILNAMKKAVDIADDLFNLNNNMKKIKDIFNIK